MPRTSLKQTCSRQSTTMACLTPHLTPHTSLHPSHLTSPLTPHPTPHTSLHPSHLTSPLTPHPSHLTSPLSRSLEPQTIESLNLLKKKKTPFVVALNKVDRLYEWKPNKHKDVQEVLELQGTNTKLEFQKKKDEVILGLAEQGLNAALFWENPDPTDYITLIPTSAHSGDGMGNLMDTLVQMAQDQLAERLAFTEELQATVLEVKAIGGFGTTIDLVLVNGRLKFGQTIVLTGTQGPVVTTIKALLTPSKMQDLRVIAA